MPFPNERKVERDYNSGEKVTVPEDKGGTPSMLGRVPRLRQPASMRQCHGLVSVKQVWDTLFQHCDQMTL